LSLSTRLIDLKGATGAGVRLGPIQISDGTTSKVVDLTGADTVGDVVNRINAAGVGGVTAGIGTDGVSLTLAAGAGDDITVKEVGGGMTASDLGILQPTAAGAGVDVNGVSVKPTITGLTALADLKAGTGIDLTGLKITNGEKTAAIDLTGATTVEDLLNKINGSGIGVHAEINGAGTGVNILNPVQGTQLNIAENGGTTAADLGVRSFSPASNLPELNGGNGVRTVSGDDFTIKDSGGVSFGVDVTSAKTVQDVLDAINAAATTAGAGVTASFSTSGNGIVLGDTAGGGGTISVTPANASDAAAYLGLTGVAASGGTITGADVNSVQASGIFANLMKLRDSLQKSDPRQITAAAQGLQDDLDRVVRIRGETGARVQEIESRQNRLDDQNLATTSLLSSLQDTDFPEAVAKFQTLQTALQASLQTSGKLLNLSLLDFLG
jgi:flagellar hook-associated protein 2